MNILHSNDSISGAGNQFFQLADLPVFHLREALASAWLLTVRALLLTVTATILASLLPTRVLADQTQRGISLALITPSSIFLQTGVAEDRTSAIVLGATWDLPLHKQFAAGILSAYSEASVGRWSTEAGSGGSAWVTQLGITPAMRWSPSNASVPWFIELGVGANVILPIYRSESKKFSTSFNFGDHAAIGLRFGKGRRQEVALRVEHFSNAGIREPNPGNNFLQVRWSHRW